MAQRNSKSKPAVSFQTGSKVRVRRGVIDKDYPDMPIGGWAGVVLENHDDGMVLVEWNAPTLEAIHPVFKLRCERDGLEFKKCHIGADDLELDSDAPLDIEQPTTITTRPLSQTRQEDRIRIIFGLTSNHPVPEVDDKSLRIYYEFLTKNLVFPFTAEHGEEYGHPESVKVIRLLDPDDEPTIDEGAGVRCEVQMDGMVVDLPLSELKEPSRNRPIVRDYCDWFWNWN